MINSSTLAAALALVALPAAAHAQTCLGLAPFSTGIMQLAASGEFTNDLQGYSGSLTFGSISRAFAGVTCSGLAVLTPILYNHMVVSCRPRERTSTACSAPWRTPP